MDLKNKTVVITGGATGIGFALAKNCLMHGANVLIGEPRQDRLDDARSTLSKLGTVATFVMDVTQNDSVAAFADFAWDTFGAVHLLINNAGVGMGPGHVIDKSVDDARKLFDVNFFGVWNGVSIFGKRMVEQGTPASIYNVGSENSFFTGAPNMAGYIASKHAVRGLTEAVREEFPDFITVGMICPGFVRSELIPDASKPLAMDADEFAAKVIPQICKGQFYVVTHPYNIERIKPVHAEIEAAYAENAPRHEGDERYDIRLLMAARNRS